ncbi:Nuclear pore complex nucleoporin component [Malassezia cuniculi]|uniref:mRNA export factor GLE1 n=1 Tax=Malassezia cuniculi TaxID=948313 RepID=A0AAF0ER06_9BASI|nr:Nuclear pore complex nucleoporin component [Malassezia cuniculi]
MTSRLAQVAPRRPTGRYVYESDSDDDIAVYGQGNAAAAAAAAAAAIAVASLEYSSDEESDLDSPPAGAARTLALANAIDPWDEWDQQCRQQAWRAASRNTVPRATSVQPKHDDVNELESMLSRFQLQQREAEARDKAEFEQRNAKLWDGIEKAIREAEKRAAHEAEQLAAARKRQEQAEAEAKRAREAEQARIAAEQRAAAEKRAKEEEQAKERLAAEAEAKRTAGMRGGDAIWPPAKAEYDEWTREMTRIKQDILPKIRENPDMRKRAFAAKRAITPKIGQLTNSASEITRITDAIDQVLREARNEGEIMYTWALNHLAKCLIRQAEQEVAAKQDTAFPLARVALGLVLLGHDIGTVLMARLVKKCPWVLGYVPPRDGLAEDAYRRKLGFKTSDETSQLYASRMSGICALYFAVLQSSISETVRTIKTSETPETLAGRVPESLRPSRMWTWQVRSMTPPHTQQPLVPALWCTFAEVAGPASLTRYGKQAAKLWRLLLGGVREHKLGPSGGPEHDAVHAALVKLQLVLEAWEQGSLDAHTTGGRYMDS